MIEVSHLLRGVALPHCYGVILQRVVVHRDSKRHADLVCAGVSLADRRACKYNGKRVDEPGLKFKMQDPTGHPMKLQSALQ